MAKYCDLFVSFFKVGAFTIGGGYAMIPLMQRELVERHGWMDEGEFLDSVALCQALPGVFAVNMAAMSGYRLRGLRGAVAAVAGTVAVPVAVIVLLAVFYRAVRGNVWVERVFMGIRPAVVALIAVPVFNMARTARVGWSNCWVTLVAAALIWLLGVSPVWVVLGAIVLGLAAHWLKPRGGDRG